MSAMSGAIRRREEEGLRLGPLIQHEPEAVDCDLTIPGEGIADHEPVK
jgi:hypothetical protein